MEYISPISSAVMAVIWIVYFQLFLIQYQRNNRPYMVIHHAQNENPDALAATRGLCGGRDLLYYEGSIRSHYLRVQAPSRQ